jgi:hypothetical protein
MSSVVPQFNYVRGLGQYERELKAKRASEFSFGPGLVPPQFEGNDPAHGGRYRPIAPPVEPTVTAARGTFTRPCPRWYYC